MVKKGDTLSVIAQKYGINNLYHILVANDLTNASKIRVGQKLLLPNPTKDPTPKKPAPTPAVAQKTSSHTSPKVVPKVPAKNSSSAPRTLTYGSYSLDLKVEK